MRVTFLMPCYPRGPMGGFRVVYEYANMLAGRGHEVAVVHPRHLRYAVLPERLTLRNRLLMARRSITERMKTPSVEWQPIDKRVRLLFVANSDPCHIPDGDALFATSWHTVRSVLESPREKGEKCYLIQGYETWDGHKELVDATWRSNLRKVVIAKWLVALGKELGCADLTYIPNAIDNDRYRLTRPIEGRSRQVAMLFSSTPIKGSAEGIEALRIARERYPDLKAVFFGTSRHQSWIPEWVTYHRDPPQDFIVNEIYNKSCVFLAPSWTEGSPLPPAEAARCGCAIAATDIGGFREYIQHGVTGLLSPCKDPQALAENLCLLLEDEDLRVRLAKACHGVISSLNWESSTDLLERFLLASVKGAADVHEAQDSGDATPCSASGHPAQG